MWSESPEDEDFRQKSHSGVDDSEGAGRVAWYMAFAVQELIWALARLAKSPRKASHTACSLTSSLRLGIFIWVSQHVVERSNRGWRYG